MKHVASDSSYHESLSWRLNKVMDIRGLVWCFTKNNPLISHPQICCYSLPICLNTTFLPISINARPSGVSLTPLPASHLTSNHHHILPSWPSKQIQNLVTSQPSCWYCPSILIWIQCINPLLLLFSTFNVVLGDSRLTYDVVVVSGEPWRDSAIHTPVSILPQTPHQPGPWHWEHTTL